MIESDFQAFASIECSHIVFEQKQKEDMLFSEEIENFTMNNSLGADWIFEMDDEEVPQKLKPIVKINNSIPNL